MDGYHLEVVESLEHALAFGTEEMTVVLVLDALLPRRIGPRAQGTFEGPVLGVIHVLVARLLGVEPLGAGVAFELRRRVSGGLAMVIPSSPAGREGLAASAAFEVEGRRHDEGGRTAQLTAW